MRLIDADSFIEYANKRLDIFADELTGMINEQPTAFDVEKVVEELEEARRNREDTLTKAISIVRKGGVE